MTLNFSRKPNVFLKSREELKAVGSTAFKRTKENIIYIWKILINILDNNGKTDNLSAPYKQQILSGKLLNTLDPKRDNETAEKLKALFLALDIPENREKFLKSYFCAALIVLRNGSKDVNSNETWVNYKPKYEQNLKYKGALNSALIEFKDEEWVGDTLFDMSAYLDTIIKKDGNEKFVLTNISAHEGETLIEAVEHNLKDLKLAIKGKFDIQRPKNTDGENFLNNDENE